MIPKPTTDHLDALVAAIQLPENLAARRTILVTLLALLPKTYDRRELISQQIHHIRSAEAIQMRLLADRPHRKPRDGHDGDGDHTQDGHKNP